MLDRAISRKDLDLAGEIYLDTPTPRKPRLSQWQLHNLVTLIFNTHTDSLATADTAIRILDDLALELSPSEQTKLVYFHTRTLPGFEQVAQVAVDRQFFHPHTWSFLIDTYPGHIEHIIQLMQTRVPADGGLVRCLVEKCSSLNTLLNLTDLCRAQKIHLDRGLLERIVLKLAVFGQHDAVLSILEAMFASANKVAAKPFHVQRASTHQPWVKSPTVYEHHGLYSIKRSASNNLRVDSVNEWLQTAPDMPPVLYAIAPTPFLLHGLFMVSAAQFDRVAQLLNMMTTAQLPILNKTVLHLVAEIYNQPQVDRSHVDLCSRLISHYAFSRDFNSYLETQIINPQFNKQELLPFVMALDRGDKIVFDISNGAGWDIRCYDSILFDMVSSVYQRGGNKELAKKLSSQNM
ncbi:hypothetical protein OGAPHI_001055 [Ogataea philodendri]|uniref:Uncharacterized protein n=1 Tax=Ogataea philodendri TaxID=1378263 RepID=A0A9P8PFD4_9ASCO|nr:uncharacterized protein OGAPHI_001055 [Ogataea philodendri]KAH3670540.1 hypothetical protein OGAPHI_001055 [Ogataea philodendri]